MRDQERRYNNLLEMGLSNFFSFIDHAQNIDSITISNFSLNNYYEQCQDDQNELDNDSDLILKCDKIIALARQRIKTLQFTRCDLLKGFITKSLQLFPSVETLIYSKCCFLNTVQYGSINKIKELRVINCYVYRHPNLEEDQEQLIRLRGVSIDIIKRLIGNELLEIQPIHQQLKILEADIQLEMICRMSIMMHGNLLHQLKIAL
ncbi:hypothetical protein FGO68_gene17387 [Halteria grandinella]|uniref:Uncharacterized protein n=1 Tax=Halteria grandinella TaxID=5974 RepID=A0A8J8NQD2_HALGN|nr:hypothetical protein FGO68_gene17387 [Halteria grandinella]